MLFRSARRFATAPSQLHTIRIGGRTPMDPLEVKRQSTMGTARFLHQNPAMRDPHDPGRVRSGPPVPAGTPVRVPTTVDAIYAGRDHRP